MKVLKFNLSGKFAFFKNEVMNDMYDTYPHIHKPALLGLFGAMLGYNGYAQTQKVFGTKEIDFPEYYEKLKDLKIAIVPKKQSFTKVLETFTNTTSMFNRVTVMKPKVKKEDIEEIEEVQEKVKGEKTENKVGSNLIVQQFWLENPSWDIYLVIDNDESKKIEDSVLNYKSVYSLYLGANNHFANISDIGILEAKEITEKGVIINSLVKDEEINSLRTGNIKEDVYFYDYILPTLLSPKSNIYKKEDFILTNDTLEMRKNKAYNVNGVNVVFY
jgi:CRISPR-associated protein Cas5, Hmari subtype